MDTPTQALLGATFGQALFGHRLGRKAAWFGALGGVLPDLDGILVQPLGPFATWLYHRSFTHALWFGPVVGAALGWAVWRLYARRRARRLTEAAPAPAEAGPVPGQLDPGERAALPWWIGLFVVSIVTHPLLDLFTTYGTQLLWPFATTRFAWDAVAIVDPLYSLVLVAALVLGSRWRRRPDAARVAAGAALVLTTGYLFYAGAQNAQAIRLAEEQLRAEGVEAAEVHAWPTVFQPWLRRVVARTPDGGVRLGHVSTWAPRPIGWRTWRPARTPEVLAARATWQGEVFEWFSAGWSLPLAERSPGGTTVRFYDLRIGVPGSATPSLWGIEATFRTGPDGRRRLASIERFRDDVDRVGERLVALWRATFRGDTSQL
jgi:inner membrane protein